MNFLKIVTIHLALFALPALFAQDCLKNHIEDAIKINKQRKPLYSKISNGRSRKISNTLIFLEKATLLINKIKGYDRKANYFHEYGIPILCNDLLSMESIEDFQVSRSVAKQSFSSIEKYKYLKVYKPFRKALRNKDFKNIATEAQSILDEIPQGYYCMLKHLLETVKTMASNTPAYIEKAQQEKIKSPARLMLSLIKEQLKAITLILPLDRWAGPLQEKGISILCSDVPHLGDE